MTAAIITKTKPQNSNSASLATEQKATEENMWVYKVFLLAFCDSWDQSFESAQK